jgi:hypothetical protein
MVGVEYLLVVFPEKRAVLADDDEVGFTNHTLLLPASEYTISLAGSGYTPASIDVVLNGTSVVQPKVVSFDLAPVPATRGTRTARAASKRRRARSGQQAEGASPWIAGCWLSCWQSCSRVARPASRTFPCRRANAKIPSAARSHEKASLSDRSF